MDKNALVESAKTILRGIYFGLLGVVALVLTVVATNPDVAQATVNVPVFDFTLSVGSLIVAGAAAAVKVVDRYRHNSTNTTSNGIAPKFLQR
jgi:hypothetical protein